MDRLGAVGRQRSHRVGMAAEREGNREEKWGQQQGSSTIGREQDMTEEKSPRRFITDVSTQARSMNS